MVGSGKLGHVEITTGETSLVKFVFSGTPGVGFPLQAKVRDILG